MHEQELNNPALGNEMDSGGLFSEKQQKMVSFSVVNRVLYESNCPIYVLNLSVLGDISCFLRHMCVMLGM